jgi:hypothetical protein
MLILTSNGTARVGTDRSLTEVAHAARCSDHGDTVELTPSGALSGTNSPYRHPQHTRGQLRAQPSRRHDRHDLPLELVQLRYEISRSRDPVSQLNYLIRSRIIRRCLCSDLLELDP